MARATSIGPRAATGLDVSADAAGGIPRYGITRRGGNNDRLSTLWRGVISLAGVARSFSKTSAYRNFQCHHRDSMRLDVQSNDVNAAAANGKEAAYFGVPQEDAYGYTPAIKFGDTIRVSSRLSHDEKGNLIAPASLDESGEPAEFSLMQQEMRATTPMPSSFWLASGQRRCASWSTRLERKSRSSRTGRNRPRRSQFWCGC